MVEEQERWFREECQQWLEEDRTWVSTEHQEQVQHQDEARWAPTPSISDSEPTAGAYGEPNEPPESATSPYDDGPLDRGDSRAEWYRTQTPTTDTRPPPPPLEYDMHRTTNDDDDTHVASFECDEFDGDVISAGPDRDAIELLVNELVVPGVSRIDWAEDVDTEMGLDTQGEYTPANYPPSSSSTYPAPLQQPPPITIYVPPRINYEHPRDRYRPPRTRYTSQRPPYRPRTRPQRERRPPRENQLSHVTATRHDDFRATTRVVPAGPPKYVPPALRDIKGTPRCSFQQNPWSQTFRRDPPPHRDPQNQVPRPSDSPNWRAHSPNRPATSRSLSPPPQPPMTPPASPSHPLEMPHVAPQRHPESQLGSELVALIKATSDALRGIALVAEKLVRRVNAERRLAHRPRRISWSLRGDAHGNTVRPQPPVFPSGRGVPVTGSLGDSEAIA
jgi:hypothetical protein